MSAAREVRFEELYGEPSRNGLTRPRAVRGSGAPMVNMGELFEFPRIGAIPMDRVPVTPDELNRFGVRPGDLLFARQSLVKEGAGKCSIVMEISEPTVFESHLIRVRLDPGIAHPLYFFYLFKSHVGFQRIQSIVTQVAAAGIRGSELGRLRVPVPRIEDQRRVAAILGAYDELIEVNRRRIAVLEEMARRLFEEWFVHFRFPGHDAVRFAESDLGRLPESWQRRVLGTVLSHSIGGGWGQEIESEEFSVPAYVIRGTDIPNIRRGSLGRSPLRFHTPSNFRSRKVQHGDIIFEVSGGSKDQPVGRSVLLGERLLARASHPVICASFCRLVRADAALLLPELLRFHFERIYENREILKYQTQSTGITNFKFTMFLEKEFVLQPDRRTQLAFASQVRPLLCLAEALGVQNDQLRNAQDLLLPKLISGEFNVTAAERELEAVA